METLIDGPSRITLGKIACFPSTAREFVVSNAENPIAKDGAYRKADRVPLRGFDLLASSFVVFMASSDPVR